MSTAITKNKSLHFTCLDSAALLTPSKDIFVYFEVKTEESVEASSYLKSNLVQPVL